MAADGPSLLLASRDALQERTVCSASSAVNVQVCPGYRECDPNHLVGGDSVPIEVCVENHSTRPESCYYTSGLSSATPRIECDPARPVTAAIDSSTPAFQRCPNLAVINYKWPDLLRFPSSHIVTASKAEGKQA